MFSLRDCKRFLYCVCACECVLIATHLHTHAHDRLQVRCLEIVGFLFEHSRSNLPELESLYSNCVLPALQQACPEMREVAVKCLGLYSCLDVSEARTNLPLSLIHI